MSMSRWRTSPVFGSSTSATPRMQGSRSGWRVREPSAACSASRSFEPTFDGQDQIVLDPSRVAYRHALIGQRAGIAIEIETAVGTDREAVDRERGSDQPRPEQGLALQRVAGRWSGE